jgi:hypothetical protein
MLTVHLTTLLTLVLMLTPAPLTIPSKSNFNSYFMFELDLHDMFRTKLRVKESDCVYVSLHLSFSLYYFNSTIVFASTISID